MFEKIENTKPDKNKQIADTKKQDVKIKEKKPLTVKEGYVTAVAVILCILAFVLWTNTTLLSATEIKCDKLFTILSDLPGCAKYTQYIVLILQGLSGTLTILLGYQIFKHLMQNGKTVIYLFVYFAITTRFVKTYTVATVATVTLQISFLLATYLTYFLLSEKYKSFGDVHYFLIGVILGYLSWTYYRFAIIAIPYFCYIAGNYFKNKRFHALLTHLFFTILGVITVSIPVVYPLYKAGTVDTLLTKFRKIIPTHVTIALIIAILIAIVITVMGTYNKATDIIVQACIVVLSIFLVLLLGKTTMLYFMPFAINCLIIIAGIIRKIKIATL